MISKLPRKHRLGISSIPRPQSIAVAASSHSRADGSRLRRFAPSWMHRDGCGPRATANRSAFCLFNLSVVDFQPLDGGNTTVLLRNLAHLSDFARRAARNRHPQPLTAAGRSASMRPPGRRTQRDSAPTPEKRHSRGEGRQAGKGLARIGGREHAVHEPLISSVIVEERDGPSAGAGTAGAAGGQASGFFHARPGKRAKSPSVEQSRQPCSIASAAR
jgi:hypothetical protein